MKLMKNIACCRASDFPFQKKQFSISKKVKFRFHFIIGNVEFDEITIISKESVDRQNGTISAVN